MSTSPLLFLRRWGPEGLLCAEDLERVARQIELSMRGEASALMDRDVVFALLREVILLRAKIGDLDGTLCRVCACTEHTPCDPPCAWADEGLCDACEGHELAPARPTADELVLIRAEIEDYLRAEPPPVDA